MITCSNLPRVGVFRSSPNRRVRAFSLVELLTVIFIISLLISILIPSINSARTQAKKSTTANTMRVISTGLEMFKNDNETDFRQTNGYPPSFAHPPISGYTFQAYKGEFPFLENVSQGSPPVVYGAHWLPAMLMGVDQLGYVKKRTVPNRNNLKKRPDLWYSADPLNAGANAKPLERQQLYVDTSIRTLKTEALTGRPPKTGGELFPDWDTSNQEGMQSLPVIVDSFDQPILYYVANTYGKTSNMVHDKHEQTNDIYNNSAPQQRGIPYYFHQDNEGFTGNNNVEGWNFGSREAGHAIAKSGALLNPLELVDQANFDTFARYIVDRKVFTNISLNPKINDPLRPVNADRYLLISAGPDGRFGTSDDVNNLPPWPDN